MVLITPYILYGQGPAPEDTIKIKEVIISRVKSVSMNTGFKRSSIDTTVLKEFSNKTISDVLSGNSMIFIKNYGRSGTATPSFRGTGASETLVSWNGININSPMLGQSDLSIIPAGLIDDIQIYYGGASMVLNNGGIGGAINLETKPVWRKGIMTSVSSGIGSFGEYSGFAKIKAGNEQFQSVTKAFFLTSENNFRYESSQDLWGTMTGNRISQRGFIQELYFKSRVNVVSARLWYQTADRHLPPIGMDLHERQSDEAIRFMLNDNLSLGRTSYIFTGAWLEDRLHYTNFTPQSSVDSRNRSDLMITKFGSETQLNEHTKLKITLNNEFTVVNTNNYDKRKMRNTASVTSSLERECNDRFGMTLLLREIMTGNNLLIPDFSTGVQIRLSNSKESYLKANFSRNSRVPTMNDLYYYPYGNQNLKNEYAYIYEVSYVMNHNFSDSFKISPELSVFRNYIKDMLLWHIQGNNLSVDNINRVKSTGLEANFSMTYSESKFSARLNTGYSYTRATTVLSYLKDDAAIGKQLLYVPVNQVNSTLHLSFGNIYSSWGLHLTGDRYITSDNSDILPGYLLNNLIAGIKLPLHATLFDLNFEINNLFNVSYQSIVSYPMPGRSYSVKLLVQFSK